MRAILKLLSRLIRKTAGNARALTRLLVIVACIAIAQSIGVYTSAPATGSIIVGSFIGAALSLGVNWLVVTLEDQDLDATPAGFLLAAKTDLISAGYYREDQTLRVSTRFDEDLSADVVELRFTAKIIPVTAPVTIRHPRIEPPAKATLIESRYSVGGDTVDQHGGFYKRVNAETTDELVVKYRLDDQAPIIEDGHLWASPVLNYSVRYEVSDRFSFEVGRIIAGLESETLQKERRGTGRFIEFLGHGAAFTTQGLKWRLRRVPDAAPA
jgi:hypothetical protein